MHFEILDKERINILEKLNDLGFIKDFYLIGGTSLSLQLGLRKSTDFDFATDKHFDIELVERLIIQKFGNKVKVIDRNEIKSSLNLYFGNAQISFFEYTHKLINKAISYNSFPNINFGSIEDILCMKAVAINQRGSKKDFYDFASIIKINDISPRKFINLMLKKFNNLDTLKNLSFSLIYFEDAESNELPDVFYNFNWDDVKKYIIQFQKQFVKCLSINY